MKSDYDFRGRTYFPNVDFLTFSSSDKIIIERVVQEEFDVAYNGIKELPSGARLGVYTAYKYYRALFNKIKLADVAEIKENRIRIPNSRKLILLGSSALKNRLNLL
jgi:phytoene/squalene synthetase